MLLQLSILVICQTMIVKPTSQYKTENLDTKFIQGFIKYGINDDMTKIRDKLASNNLGNSMVTFGLGGYTVLRDCDVHNLPEMGTGRGFTQEYAPCNDIDVKPENDAPESFDWSSVLTSVKEQGKTCMADSFFAVAGNVEAQYAIKNNKSVDLSTQQLLDCDQLSDGCLGAAFLQYVIGKLVYEGGLMREADYPYQSKTITCSFDKTKVKVNVTGCNRYEVDEEDDLREVLYKVGPLAISVDPKPMESYTGGIITDCSLTVNSSTGMLLVGYGTENGVDFWKIKTSRGLSYGEKGFVRIERGRACCGIGAQVFSAIID